MSEWIIMLNDYPIGFVKATQEEIVKITRHLVEKKLLPHHPLVHVTQIGRVIKYTSMKKTITLEL